MVQIFFFLCKTAVPLISKKKKKKIGCWKNAKKKCCCCFIDCHKYKYFGSKFFFATLFRLHFFFFLPIYIQFTFIKLQYFLSQIILVTFFFFFFFSTLEEHCQRKKKSFKWKHIFCLLYTPLPNHWMLSSF